MLIFGSTAIQQHVDLGRNPSDIDLIARLHEIRWLFSRKDWDQFYPTGKNKYYGLINGVIYDIEVAENGNSAEQLLDALNVPDYKSKMAPLDVCYTLKLTHRYMKNSPHFRKTMKDIKKLREAGCEIPDYLQDWFVLREEETYNYSHPKLNTNKDNFFKDDNIEYFYDHDSLHQAVKLYRDPAYEYFKKDDEEVLCSKDKFFNECSDDIRLAAVYEEICVLALERAVVPNNMDHDKAFMIALMKVCTSITSGWFREFAWENYDRVVELYRSQNVDYIDRFEIGLEEGVVIPTRLTKMEKAS